MRTKSLKQLFAVENVKTRLNLLESIRNKESKDRSIWVNITYILHGTIYSVFAYYMRNVQSNFRNHIIKVLVLTRFTSPPNSTPRQFPSYLLLTLLYYFLYNHPYWISLLFLPCLPCNSNLAVTEQQQRRCWFFMCRLSISGIIYASCVYII